MRLAPWALLLLFMAKVGTYQNARQLAPYYVFLFPSVLVMAGHAPLVRRCWWQRFGLAVMVSAVALVIVSRERPLAPMETIAARLRPRWPRSRFLARVQEAYMIPSSAGVLRKPFAGDLPPQEAVLGYATLQGACEPGLSAPFGTRRVERVLPGDSARQLSARGIRYLVLEDDFLAGKPLDYWLTQYHAEIVSEISHLPASNRPTNHLYLIRLKLGL